MKKILLMLCILACVTGCNKNTKVEESKVIENQPEVVQENVEKEVKNESKQETEKVLQNNKESKYERVTSIPDEHIAYINSIEKLGEDYLVKAQLYGPFVFDKEEVESKFKNNEKIYFKTDMYGEDGWYIVSGDSEKWSRDMENVEYLLKDGGFYLEKNEQGNYRVRTTAQMDPWMLTDKYVEMIVDRNASIVTDELYYATPELISTIKDFYEQNKGKYNVAKESEHPSDSYMVQFTGDKVIKFSKRKTSI